MVKILIFLFLLILHSSLVASLFLPVRCNFGEQRDGYTCLLEEIVSSLSRNDSFLIYGFHDPERSDGDVVKLVFQKGSKMNFIPRIIFKKFKNLKIVVAEDCGIQSFEQNDLLGAENLESFSLGQNFLRSLEASTFSGAPNLMVLKISRNLVESLEQEAFTGLSKLEVLELNANKISSLYPRTFQHTKSLKSINLSGNLINELFDYDLFTGLRNLTSLLLSTNKITRIHPTLFIDLENLKHLDMSSNQLIRLDAFILRLNFKLETLNCGWNRISEIDYKFFDSLRNLKELELGGNLCIDRSFDFNEDRLNGILPAFQKCFDNFYPEISIMICTFEFDEFSGEYSCMSENVEFFDGRSLFIAGSHEDGQHNENVVHVKLRNSRLHVLPFYVFRDFINLKYLTVESAGLKELFISHFQFCSEVEGIFLGNNELINLGRNSFYDCKNLKDLRFENNQIEELNPMVFGGLDDLMYVDLSFNKIRGINTEVFKDLEKLSQIRLNNNQLTAFDPQYFSVASSLISLDLSYNQISKIQPSQFQEIFKNLRDLNLEGNACLSERFQFWGSQNIQKVTRKFNNCFKNWMDFYKA
jgi:Leucine-rich repeat (LRR) protein